MSNTQICVIAGCCNTQMPHSLMCSAHIAESQRQPVAMNMDVCPDCNRNEPNMEHCERCNPQVYPTHCSAHGDVLGEGDICGTCERLGDAMVSALDVAMAAKPYELWFVLSKHLYRTPVSNFSEAKILFYSVVGATGVRIARMCAVEGCEVVLHKFN